MKILVSGANGFVGKALLPELRRHGHSVAALRRPGKAEQEDVQSVRWNPGSGEIDIAAINKWGQPEAFIHFAGENIAAKRWSKAQKRLLWSSRVDATEKLCESLIKAGLVPRVFASASAVGLYGDRGDELLTEESSRGAGFLAELTREWERASSQLPCRQLHFRFGMILGRAGGALSRMLPAFKLGLGGKLGSGKQWVSWVHLKDVVQIILFALNHPTLAGSVNVVAPVPVTNAEFTQALAKAVARPAIFRIPRFALRLLFGELADTLLGSQRVLPHRLLDSGYVFEYAALEPALADCVKKKKPG